jgi:BlaI family transcriptional regulator, penicillinase repressor
MQGGSMKEKSVNKPTESELEILQILWEHGPGTVRFVNEQLNLKKKVGYTTTLKIMQIMYEKGILKRDAHSRSHLYSPVIEENETQKVLLGRFLDTVFGGSALKLVMQALGNHNASREEISQIRSLLDNLDERTSENLHAGNSDAADKAVN